MKCWRKYTSLLMTRRSRIYEHELDHSVLQNNRNKAESEVATSAHADLLVSIYTSVELPWWSLDSRCLLAATTKCSAVLHL